MSSVQAPRRPLETELISKGPDSKPSVNPDPSPHPWGLPSSLPDGVGSLSFQGPRPRLGSVWRGHSPLNRDPELEKRWKEEALAVCLTSAKASLYPLPPDSPRASPWTLKAAAQCPIRFIPRLPLCWLSSCPYPARPPEGTTSCPGLLFLLPWSPPC